VKKKKKKKNRGSQAISVAEWTLGHNTMPFHQKKCHEDKTFN
jgi:hypothetical protein